MESPATKFLLGGTFIIVGLCMLLFGTKLINWITGFLIFLTLAILLLTFFCLVIFQASISINKFILSSVISVVLALILAYLITKKLVVVGVGMLGAWTLLSVGFLLVPLFGLAQDKTGNGIRWAIYSVLGLVGFVLGVWKSEPVKIFLTAFIGAFFFIRGISVYAGGFPNEFALAQGTNEAIHPAFYGYCVGILVLFILSILFQRRYCQDKKSEGEELEEELLNKGAADGGFKRVSSFKNTDSNVSKDRSNSMK